ncbi:MAG: helix-turn-helix transcriptional regulator [Limnobacter sp.]|nr:helix-turn-helix transcriptional regulator [Limnobacter sp.]
MPPIADSAWGSSVAGGLSNEAIKKNAGPNRDSMGGEMDQTVERRQNFERRHLYSLKQAQVSARAGLACASHGAKSDGPAVLPTRMALDGAGARGAEADWLRGKGSTAAPEPVEPNPAWPEPTPDNAAGSGQFRAEAVLDSLNEALLVFATDGEVLYCNRATRRLLACHRGVALGGGGQAPLRLVCASSRAAARLATALRTRRSETVGILLDTQMRLVLKLMPEADGVRVAYLLALDGGRFPENEGGWLSEAFALSPAEGRALEALSGADLTRDAAAMLGISSNTLKDHLASIYSKTGCSRKVQLFRLMGLAYGV